MTTMNNKRKDKDPLFAEVKLTGEEFKQSPNNFKKKQYLCRVSSMNEKSRKQTGSRLISLLFGHKIKILLTPVFLLIR